MSTNDNNPESIISAPTPISGWHNRIAEVGNVYTGSRRYETESESSAPAQSVLPAGLDRTASHLGPEQFRPATMFEEGSVAMPGNLTRDLETGGSASEISTGSDRRLSVAGIWFCHNPHNDENHYMGPWIVSTTPACECGHLRCQMCGMN